MLFGVAWGITTLAVLANILNDSIYDIKYDNVGCNTRGLYNQDEFSKRNFLLFLKKKCKIRDNNF